MTVLKLWIRLGMQVDYIRIVHSTLLRNDDPT